MLIRIDNVAREFSGKAILSGITAQINDGEHIGLIGANGSGKTTLLKLISGESMPDQGRVIQARGLTIAEVPQGAESRPGHSVREEALSAFQGLRLAEDRLKVLELQMSEAREVVDPALAHEYERLQLQVALGGGYDYPARAEAALLGLGFLSSELTMPCSHLSGGQISRLLLAKAVLKPSNLLLLDEPTNHLDLDGILWLTTFMKERPGALVVVSHDRRFLDQVTGLTWEIEKGRLTTYTAGYSESRRQKENRLRVLEKEWVKQEEQRRRTEDFIRRNIAGQKTRQAQSRRKMLERMQRLENPSGGSEELSIRIDEGHRGGLLSFRLEGASIGYGQKRLVEGIDLTVWRGQRIAILGGNGSGKSTLLKSLIGEIPLLEGDLEWGANTQPAYHSQSPFFPAESETVYDCLRDMDSLCSDEELRSFAARFLFRGEDIQKKLNDLSGGERSRLALARLLFFPANVLVMDEPTNHLDIAGREALESALSEYQGSLLVVSHDLYFVERVADRYLSIEGGRLKELKDLREITQRTSGRAAGPQPTRGESSRPRGPLNVRQGLSKNELQRRQLRLKELEESIIRIEERCKAALGALERTGDYQEALELSREHEALDKELQHLYRSWEDLAEEISGF